MKKILVVLGTRPEVIKLAPVILELKKSVNFEVSVCNTEQQKELSNQTLSFFGLKADINLDVMRSDQQLCQLQARILTGLSDLFVSHHFDAVIVQGDTMSVFCGALAAFYNKIPVFHVEAGLRSYNIFEPFPEEALRQMVSRITELHFAPTSKAAEALLKEGIDKRKIFLTGNTVIDALHCVSPQILKKAEQNLKNKKTVFNDKLVLVTVHRRENHGERLGHIIKAVQHLAEKYTDHQFVLPVHPNPNVKERIYNALSNYQNIILLPPADYPELVSLMKCAKIVMTDSGGIQEEGPSFGAPILVLRYKTERMEGVEAGFSQLVGADYNKIVTAAETLLNQEKHHIIKNGIHNPYGDGHAAKEIYNIMESFFKRETDTTTDI